MALHPVFRVEEFYDAYLPSGRSKATATALLRYHVKIGKLLNLRRGLYAHVGWVDPWVLGSRMTREAVVAYDGALSFHGLAVLGNGISYLSPERSNYFCHNEVVYTGVRSPGLCKRFDTVERAGQKLRVTSLACTLVDLLDRLDLAPAPIELFDCFRRARDLDFSEMASRARDLNALVFARLGFFLEHLRADPLILDRLERFRPASPAYFNRADRTDQQVFRSRWNLLVPLELALHAERLPRLR